MDLRSRLADIPSGVGKDLLIGEVIKSNSHLNKLLELALHEKDPVAWRASWILDGSDEKKPGLARKHINKIVISVLRRLIIKLNKETTIISL